MLVLAFSSQYCMLWLWFIHLTPLSSRTQLQQLLFVVIFACFERALCCCHIVSLTTHTFIFVQAIILLFSTFLYYSVFTGLWYCPSDLMQSDTVFYWASTTCFLLYQTSFGILARWVTLHALFITYLNNLLWFDIICNEFSFRAAASERWSQVFCVTISMSAADWL